jgi:hypothetical protein
MPNEPAFTTEVFDKIRKTWASGRRFYTHNNVRFILKKHRDGNHIIVRPKANPKRGLPMAIIETPSFQRKRQLATGEAIAQRQKDKDTKEKKHGK